VCGPEARDFSMSNHVQLPEYRSDRDPEDTPFGQPVDSVSNRALPQLVDRAAPKGALAQRFRTRMGDHIRGLYERVRNGFETIADRHQPSPRRRTANSVG
jgi:hypothetical protein